MEACRRGVDILFFIYSARKRFARRTVRRDTLAHAAMLGVWNSTIVFVLAGTEAPTLAAWNKLEMEAFGDAVTLPFKDVSANLIYKFTMGLHWMSAHCPNVKHVIKHDDDISIRPVQLRNCLRKRVNPQDESESIDETVNCFVWNQMHIYREVNHLSYVPYQVYPDSAFYPYRSGRVIIMQGWILPEVYQMSLRIPHLCPRCLCYRSAGARYWSGAREYCEEN
ncbi:UDP-GalNAc:beta-1,3-N-acetylgalactosaminyltransferase 1-like [Ornithodoros turicata]|uniref:UDP-GalNAc:beta-1, 3-N-acetylgalactosaminyltransferase 1-like n=1 Tax=Ornithodoros turicata TaxID=34597 RepID=UPI00313898C1